MAQEARLRLPQSKDQVAQNTPIVSTTIVTSA